MINQFARTEILVGSEAIKKLQQSHVAVFGVGGVGGFVVESLVRAGVGTIDLIDHDDVSLTNCNRQIIATHNVIGEKKVDVLKERCLAINPKVKVIVHDCFFLPDNADEFDFHQYDYVIDAVDTVTAKLEIIMQAKQADVPVISCMGAGNKLNSALFQVADLYETEVCPLAKVMRKECKKRGIEHVKVVYSKEKPVEAKVQSEEVTSKRAVPGSTAFAPAVAGLLMGEEVFRDLIAY